MDFSASAAPKDAARNRRRRSWTPPRFSSTLPGPADPRGLSPGSSREAERQQPGARLRRP